MTKLTTATPLAELTAAAPLAELTAVGVSLRAAPRPATVAAGVLFFGHQNGSPHTQCTIKYTANHAEASLVGRFISDSQNVRIGLFGSGPGRKRPSVRPRSVWVG
jgi:hypothetical protein